MAGVKRTRDGAVGLLTLNEPASLNAMTRSARRTRHGHRRDDERPRNAGAVADRCGPRVLFGPEPQGIGGPRDRYRRWRHALLLAGASGAARVSRAHRGRGQWVAAGGGFSLAMSGDIIVAARSASFIQIFSRTGLVPDLAQPGGCRV
jgi:2-(1,2-epoxy-1,2-dihydrophenyl)acetyl-CoA isomerase